MDTVGRRPPAYLPPPPQPQTQPHEQEDSGTSKDQDGGFLGDLRNLSTSLMCAIQSFEQQTEYAWLLREQRHQDRIEGLYAEIGGLRQQIQQIPFVPGFPSERRETAEATLNGVPEGPEHCDTELSPSRTRPSSRQSIPSEEHSLDSNTVEPKESDGHLLVRVPQDRGDRDFDFAQPRRMRVAFNKASTRTGTPGPGVGPTPSTGYLVMDMPTMSSNFAVHPADHPRSGMSTPLGTIAQMRRENAVSVRPMSVSHLSLHQDSGSHASGVSAMHSAITANTNSGNLLHNTSLETPSPLPLQRLTGDTNVFELATVWKPEQQSKYVDRMTHHFRSGGSRYRKIASFRRLAITGLVADGGMSDDLPERPRFVISPLSHSYLLWNILFAVVLSYEVMYLPLQVFEVPEDGFVLRAAWIAAVFWTLDIPVSCVSGFVNKEGQVITDRSEILRHYSGTWLVPDVIIVSLDWLTLMKVSEDWLGFADSLRIGKAVRYVRILRLARLLRLRRLSEAMHSLDDLMNSQACTIGKQIMLNLLAIIFIAHFVACAWYALGETTFDGYDSWVSYYGYEPSDWQQVYWVSLHWSLTQFTPGSMTAQPQNPAESVYSVAVLVLGLIIFSSIIGNITSATNNLKDINAWYGKQIWLLRKYFREKRISYELLAKVTRFADAVIQPKQKQVNIDDVKLLPLLPESMRMKVLLELYRPHMEVHPFFADLIVYSRTVMQKVCHSALTELVLTLDDVLFTPGQIAHCMYFLATGLLQYNMEHLDVQKTWPGEADASLGIASHKPWCCEPVLWTSWVHQGRMVALNEIEIISLDADIFQKVVAMHKSDAVFPRRYGGRFVEAMNRAGDKPLSDLMEAGPLRFEAYILDHDVSVQVHHEVDDDTTQKPESRAGTPPRVGTPRGAERFSTDFSC